LLRFSSIVLGADFDADDLTRILVDLAAIELIARLLFIYTTSINTSTNIMSGLKEGLVANVHAQGAAQTSFKSDVSGAEGATADERAGLSSEQVEELYKVHGFNELPVVDIPLWYIFIIQFTGTMPYMLELACVLAMAVEDYVDFAIIFAMVICNGYLGFHEELKAKASLEELTSKMEQKIAVLRDGKAAHLLTRLLVPGDVVLLVGGCAIPADLEWIEGDVLSIDTAGLTGEPLPRKYPSEQYGTTIYASCTVRAGEAYCIVRKTGINTMVGGSQADIAKDKATAKVSVFEEKVLFAVKIIIFISLIDVLVIFLVQGIARNEFDSNFNEVLLTCLSIIIAAVPVALPLVLQVTMALGAAKMASEFSAVVTSLPALQDISSMSILCSDKTGTLTTANISILADAVWSSGVFSQADIALYGALSSNRDKKEDPIDRSVINHFDHVYPNGLDKTAEFTKVRIVGFNPIYKRVVAEFTHATLGTVLIAKGLPAKVMNTADGGEDDALDQWKVDDFDELFPIVSQVDTDYSKKGYKTLGVSVKFNDEPWKFAGILPMIDPPRHDSARTIKNLVAAGIGVKMITGDHLNIARETATLIGMGRNIHAAECTREGTQTGNELILHADGFAQVLPKDKREVVLVLRNVYNIVTGMTGDGVNDAPALSAAQCGIAVDDATDAAKNAAAIILTTPGLSAIYSAVVESRRIFRKLKAYVTYRFAATIQIVVVLTLLIFISDCAVNSLYVILLALFNDLTMLPIAYDKQQASAVPEQPEVGKMLMLSLMLGMLESGASMLYAYGAKDSDLFVHSEDYDIDMCDKTLQAGVWLQMSIAAELLIFSARAPTYMWTSISPSMPLTISVLSGCVLTTVLAGAFDYFGGLPIQDMAIIWLYNIVVIIVIDICKVEYLKLFGEDMAVLPEMDLKEGAADEAHGRPSQPAASASMAGSHNVNPLVSSATGHGHVDALMNLYGDEPANCSRAQASMSRLSGWAADKSHGRPMGGGDQLSQSINLSQSFRGGTMSRHHNAARGRTASSSIDMEARIHARNSVSDNAHSTISHNLRPNVPSNKQLH
jgi:H+-transporting ATPase